MSWLNSIVRPSQPTAAAQNLLVPDPDIPEEEGNGEVAEVEEVAPPPAIMPNYDATHADDEEGNAMEKAINSVKSVHWMEDDLKFYFAQLEIKMKAAGVKSNFTKLQVLSTTLPKKAVEEIKTILQKQESDFTRKDAYLQAKKEILRTFGPCEGANCERALQRVMTGKPSQLAKALIGDLCEKELNGCCCIKMVGTLWRRALPSYVKQAVAHYEFTRTSLKDVLQVADDVFMSTKTNTAQVAAISPPVTGDTINTIAPEEVLNTGFSGHQSAPQQSVAAQLAHQAAQIAAIHQTMVRGRGRGRGNRGRGRGGNRGGANQYSAANPRWATTPRHADQPPFGACKRHWQFGKSSFTCLEPTTCPWRNFITTKAQN